MSGAWKGAHIRPDFGDDGLYRNPAAKVLSAFLQLFDSFPTAATGNSRSVSTSGGKSSAITCPTMHRTGEPP